METYKILPIQFLEDLHEIGLHATGDTENSENNTT